MKHRLFLACLLLAAGLLAGAQTPAARMANGIAMVPLPAVARWLGATVTVNPQEQLIAVKWGATSLRVAFNSTLAVLNGKTLTLERTPLRDGQVWYLPLNAVRKAFAVTASWDAKHTTLTLAHAKRPTRLALSVAPGDYGEALDESPMEAAIRRGKLDAVKLVLAQDPAALERRGTGGRTPLHIALMSATPDIARYLIDKGADVKATFDNEVITTSLHVAAMVMDTELVALLVEKGLDVNVTSKIGFTPLHIACMAGPQPTDAQAQKQLGVARWLLEHGAKVDGVVDFTKMFPNNAAAAALKKLPGFGTPMMLTVLSELPALEALLVKHGATPMDDATREALRQAFASERRRARQVECTGNLRQLALAALLYAQDHEEVLPAAESVWRDLKLAKEVFRCREKPEMENGYGYNALLAGKALGDLGPAAQHGKILLFADCASADHLIHALTDIDATRHGDGFIAVFLDGHAELIKDPATILLK